MFDYLEKFNSLPKDLRQKVSTADIMAAVNELEEKYGVDLAAVIMKIVIRDIKLHDLAMHFVSEFGLATIKAEQLASELKAKVLGGVADYLETGKFEPDEVVLKEEPKSPPVKPQASLATKPSAGPESGSGASFFFSADDEEEVRELAKKISSEFKDELIGVKTEEKLKTIIKETKINFGSEQLLDRFKKVVKTYLLGIRDRLETKQALMKPIKGGGLGFDDSSATEVLLISDRSIAMEKTDLQPPAKIKLPEEKAKDESADMFKAKNKDDKWSGLVKAGVRDVDYSFKDVPKQEKPVEVLKEKKLAKALDLEHELAPPPPAITKPKAANEQTKVAKPLTARLGRQAVAIKEKQAEVARPAKKPIIKPRRQAEADGKKRMEDVKYMPKVMSPIDELKFMNLVNFRRQGQSPKEIIKKLANRISLLEEDGYGKRLEGVMAWRISPLNKLYLETGSQGISKNTPIDVIIEERKSAGQEYLTIQEFEAIMDFNKSLRF